MLQYGHSSLHHRKKWQTQKDFFFFFLFFFQLLSQHLSALHGLFHSLLGFLRSTTNFETNTIYGMHVSNSVSPVEAETTHISISTNWTPREIVRFGRYFGAGLHFNTLHTHKHASMINGILDPFWKFRQSLTKFPKRIKYTLAVDRTEISTHIAFLRSPLTNTKKRVSNFSLKQVNRESTKEKSHL